MPLLLALLLALLAAAPASAQAPLPDIANPGPCTRAAGLGMLESDAHDHNDPVQHQGMSCRMRQKAFLPLIKELEGHENSKLGEIDVKGDILAVAIQEPIGGALFFDVSDPANPRFLSRYLHATCGLGDNCGAFVDLSADGKIAFLSVQQTDLMPGLIGGTAGQAPGVAVIDLADPANPVLSQEYLTVSVQGVHTARFFKDHVYLIQNGVGVEVARVESTPLGPRMVRVANIPTPDTTNITSTHDTFAQTDPTDGKDYLYMAGGFTYGFKVYDVSNPAVPTEVSTWDPTPQCANDWYAHTIDVTTVAGRRIVTMPAEQFDFGAQSDEDQAEGCGALQGNGDMPGTMFIVDATDFAAPKAITTWRSPTTQAAGPLTFSAHNQQIVGDKIFLSHYHGGVFVLDAAGAFAGRDERPREMGWAVPFDPQVRETLDSGTFSHSRGDYWDMVVYKGHVLAVDIKGGLYSLVYEGDPLFAGEPAPPPGPACVDRVAPRSVLKTVRLRRSGVSIAGTASDQGCGAMLTRVLVSVARVQGKRCRYLTVGGRLGKARSCATPSFVPARGSAKFSLKTKRRLPRGRYRVAVQALDFSGNAEALRFRTVRVR